MFDFIHCDRIDGVANYRCWKLTARFAEQQLIQWGYRRWISNLPERLDRSSPHFRRAIVKRSDKLGSTFRITEGSQLPRRPSTFCRRIGLTQLQRRIVKKAVVREGLPRAGLLCRVSTG